MSNEIAREHRPSSVRGHQWALLFLVFLLSVPAVTPRIYASDEIEYFAYLRSLWFDHDLSFENEYRHFYDAGVARSPLFHETFLERTTETGRRINFAPIGAAILWAPFYAAGDLLARFLRLVGQQDVQLDGYSTPYIAAVCYGSALYGFGAVVFSALVARRLVGHGVTATAAVWVGTPLVFYMYVAPPMSHSVSAFMVSAFVLTWLFVRDRWSLGGSIALGALAALMAMVREQDLFFAVGPALDFGRSLWSKARTGSSADRRAVTRQMRHAVAGVAAFVTVFLPQAVVYLTLNGRLGPSRLVARKMSWTAPHALDVLVSPEHGFLMWTPLAVLAIAGLVRLALRGSDGQATAEPARDLRWIALCGLTMVACQIYVAGSVESWTVAGAFGQRRFVALTVLLTTGLAASSTPWRSRWSRLALNGLIALCIVWNLGLIVQFGTGMMDRQRLELSRNAHTTFVILPRLLPELAARYLFDRSSFYQAPATSYRETGARD